MMKLLSLFLLTLFPVYGRAKEEPKIPVNVVNVVIVLIDNHGYFELSRNGHQIVRTPRIDRLARESVNFTNFYAPPFCSPSRSALLTGRYALRAGVHNTVGGVSILHRNETTVSQIFKKEGYRTGVFGKWHLGSTYPYSPKFRGFDEVFTHGGGGVSQLGDFYGNNHINATYEHNGAFVKSNGFSTDVLFDEAIQFMDKERKEKPPFFCYLSTPAVHFPTNRHPETTRRLLDRGAKDDNHLAIYSMIENVDDNIGKLLDFLEASGLKENTLLILASDQGVNDRGAVQHRSGKSQNRGLSYDEKHHVYCMVQYPELTNGNPGDTDELVGMVDIAPTIMDVCGIAKPDNLDGRSLVPLLDGSRKWDKERTLIVQCPRSRVRKKWQNTSVKYQSWRLLDGEKLFNIENDFGQNKDVAREHPGLMKMLTDAYETFWGSLAPADTLISPHILGAPEAPEVRLVGMDWYLGSAPWTQQSLAKQSAQGTWRVQIARNGNYRFELRRYPREAAQPIGADTAMVEIGKAVKEMKIPPEASEAVLEMTLKKGTYDMQTRLSTSQEGRSPNTWGAYFVHVRTLD